MDHHRITYSSTAQVGPETVTRTGRLEGRFADPVRDRETGVALFTPLDGPPQSFKPGDITLVERWNHTTAQWEAIDRAEVGL